MGSVVSTPISDDYTVIDVSKTGNRVSSAVVWWISAKTIQLWNNIRLFRAELLAVSLAVDVIPVAKRKTSSFCLI